MTEKSLQWSPDGNPLSSNPPIPNNGLAVSATGPLNEEPCSDARLAQDGSVAEVLKSIGQDCTQQVESFLERCETNQEGE